MNEVLYYFLTAGVGFLLGGFMEKKKMEIQVLGEFVKQRTSKIIEVFSSLDNLEALTDGLYGLIDTNQFGTDYFHRQSQKIEDSKHKCRDLINQERFLIGELLYVMASDRFFLLMKYADIPKLDPIKFNSMGNEIIEIKQKLLLSRSQIANELPKGVFSKKRRDIKIHSQALANYSKYLK